MHEESEVGWSHGRSDIYKLEQFMEDNSQRHRTVQGELPEDIESQFESLPLSVDAMGRDETPSS